MFFPNDLISDRYFLKNAKRGGMGEVWEAEDRILKRKVALKTVHSEFLKTNPSALKIFEDEARTGAKLLGHPNVVSVLDFGNYEIRGKINHFIIMEFVEGFSLDRWINSYFNKLDAKTYYSISIYICWEILKGIEYAHRHKILHRDIKPLNIFLSKYGITKIGDFGIARFVDEVTRTHTVWRAKSPAYAAPEQWEDEKSNYSTDRYQLGCTFYHLLCGVMPLKGTNLFGLMKAHLKTPPATPNDVNKNISEEVSEQLIGLLEKNPDDRIQLWKIYDVISKELRGEYDLEIDVSELGEDIIETVSSICNFDEDNLKEGPCFFSYEDFSECLSESIQLILAGIEDIKIIKKSREKT